MACGGASSPTAFTRKARGLLLMRHDRAAGRLAGRSSELVSAAYPHTAYRIPAYHLPHTHVACSPRARALNHTCPHLALAFLACLDGQMSKAKTGLGNKVIDKNKVCAFSPTFSLLMVRV